MRLCSDFTVSFPLLTDKQITDDEVSAIAERLPRPLEEALLQQQAQAIQLEEATYDRLVAPRQKKSSSGERPPSVQSDRGERASLTQGRIWPVKTPSRKNVWNSFRQEVR